MTVRKCIEVGCTNLTHASRCDEHERERQRARSRRRKKVKPAHHTGAWERISREARAAHPWCARCGATDDLTADHIIPGTLEGGVQVLCRSCNAKKRTKGAGEW